MSTFEWIWTIVLFLILIVIVVRFALRVSLAVNNERRAQEKAERIGKILDVPADVIRRRRS